MTQIYIDPNLKFIEVSNGSVGTYMLRCERQFMYAKIFGVPHDIDEFETGAALVGSALHKAHQEYLVSKNLNEAIKTLLFNFPHHIIHGIDDKRSVFTCISTLEQLCSMPVWDCDLLEINGRPATEVSFKILLQYIIVNGKSIPVYYVGFIDHIIIDKEGRRRIGDLKTYSGYTYDIDSKHEFDYQTTGYTAVVDMFMEPNFLPTREQFFVDYTIAQIIMVDPKVENRTFVRTQDHIANWLVYLRTFIRRLEYGLSISGFMHNSNQCHVYGRRCQHFSRCTFGDSEFSQQLLTENAASTLNKTRIPKPDILIEDRSILEYGL